MGSGSGSGSGPTCSPCSASSLAFCAAATLAVTSLRFASSFPALACRNRAAAPTAAARLPAVAGAAAAGTPPPPSRPAAALAPALAECVPCGSAHTFCQRQVLHENTAMSTAAAAGGHRSLCDGPQPLEQNLVLVLVVDLIDQREALQRIPHLTPRFRAGRQPLVAQPEVMETI